VIAGAILAGAIAIGAFYVLANDYLEDYREERNQDLERIADLAVNSVQPVIERHESGQISFEEARRRVADAIRSMVYQPEEEGGYLLAMAEDGVLLAHPFVTEDEGHNQLDLRDPHGIPIARNLLEAARQPGGGFTEYTYVDPTSGDYQKKLTYARRIPELEMVVATGRYVGDGEARPAAFVRKTLVLGFIVVALAAVPIGLSLRELTRRAKMLEHENAERLRAISQLREARDQAEKASRVKTEFLAVISHEIRTPMNAIVGFSQLLGMAENEEQRRNYVDRIDESSNALLTLVDEILEYTFVTSQRVAIKRRPTNLRAEAVRLVENYRVRAELQGLSFSGSVEDSFPVSVMADRVRLRQAFNHLVDNAIKFTPEGYVKVTLSARRSGMPEAAGSTGGNGRWWCIQFSVTDSGIGIAEDKQKQIFNLFQQADSSNTRIYGGTGLGLGVCREIAYRLGGDISCESEPGKGSTFTLSFPAEEADKAEGAEEPAGDDAGMVKAAGEGHLPSEAEAAALDILVAEDDRSNRAMLLAMLKRSGHRTEYAGDGNEVLEKLALKTYDLIVMDVQMPGLTGLEATEQIRAGKCGAGQAKVPIIGISAYLTRESRERCLQAGMNGFISKPFRLDQLQREIESALGLPLHGKS